MKRLRLNVNSSLGAPIVNETTLREVKPGTPPSNPPTPALFEESKKPGRPPGARNKPVRTKVAAKGASSATLGQAIADVLSAIEGLTPADKAKVLKIAGKI